MEDTLREVQKQIKYLIQVVLILVVMEDTLRDFLFLFNSVLYAVLILVVMEDTLRVVKVYASS